MYFVEAIGSDRYRVSTRIWSGIIDRVYDHHNDEDDIVEEEE